MLRTILKLGGILKWLTLALGVLVVGCVTCTEPEEPEGVLEFEGSTEIQIKGETRLMDEDGKVLDKHNEVTGVLMLGLADGLTDGDCWGGSTVGYLEGEWYLHLSLPPEYQTLAWHESYSEITYDGGTGSVDSVVYITTQKAWPYPVGLGWWVLWEANLYRVPPGLVTTDNLICIQEPHGTYGDSILQNDMVRFEWEITANIFDVSGEANFGTDTLAYDCVEGLRYDDMPYVLYIMFVYNNADTVLRTVSAETWYNTDTSYTKAIFTAQDTMRNTANDTLLEMRLINTNDEAVAMDTTNRYMSTNKSAKMVWTISLLEWPQ